jgi:hypothetical protein
MIGLKGAFALPSIEAALVSASRTRRRTARQWLFPAAVLMAVCAVHAQQESELYHLAAGYVHGFIEQLSNVVAQEDFDLTSPPPARKVKSDLLLVQYPGSQGDLLTFRDVSSVNGTPLPNHEARLADLFVQSFNDARMRALAIATDSAPYVPASLNPLFAIAFLQAHYQRRFKLSEKGAGGEWPKGVKELTFIETAKPTLLRSGLGSQANVPTRGKAWIEPQTGRILQTELEIRATSKTTIIVTKFGLDERLQVMVPIEMHTQNPTGTAKYTNFRRFGAKTDEQLKLPQKADGETGGRK